MRKLSAGFVISATLTSMLLTGCSTLTASEPLSWKSLYQSQNCSFDSPQLALLSSDQGQAIYKDQINHQTRSTLGSKLQVETINPEDNVLIIAMGQKGSGGYALRTQNIAKQGTSLNITVDWVTPSPNDFVTAAMTSPCEIITIHQNLIDQNFTSEQLTLKSTQGTTIELPSDPQ